MAKNLTQFSVQHSPADTRADATYSATFEKGPGEVWTQFRKIGGDWRLVSFRVNSPEFLKDLLTIACPYCGEACPASAKFCPKCGKPLAQHGENKPTSKGNSPHVNDSTTKTAPSTPSTSRATLVH